MLPNKIIFEWMDASGKSLFVQLLQKVSKYKVVHSKELFHVLNNESLKDEKAIFQQLEEFFLFMSENNKIIYDRNFISILAYLLGKQSKLVENKIMVINLISKWLASFEKGTIIFLYSNYDKITSRLKYREKRLNEELSENDLRLLDSKSNFEEYGKTLFCLSKIAQKIIERKKLDIKVYDIDTSIIPLVTIKAYYRLYDMRKRIRWSERILAKKK